MPEPWDVLVVDDEPVVRDGIARVLADEGLAVAAAPTAAAALAHPAAATCRVALCDVMLPDGSGLELLRALRASRPDLPVVIITGYATPETLARAAMAEACAILAKPFDAPELLQTVRAALSAAPRKETTP
jgi:DNA-binding NtrC family response regulator